MVNAPGMNCAEAYSSWADLRDVLFSLVSVGHGHHCLLKSELPTSHPLPTLSSPGEGRTQKKHRAAEPGNFLPISPELLHRIIGWPGLKRTTKII